MIKHNEVLVQCQHCGWVQIIKKDPLGPVSSIQKKKVIQAYSCEKCGKVNTTLYGLFKRLPYEMIYHKEVCELLRRQK